MPERVRYLRRAEEGMCVGCGRRKPAAQRVRCRPCLAAVRIANAERARKLVKAGTCRTCGQRAAKPKHRECADCLRRFAAYVAAKSKPNSERIPKNPKIPKDARR